MSSSSRASSSLAPSHPPPPPQVKRKKSAFAIGLAKLVPSVLKSKSSSSAPTQSALPPSSSHSLIPTYYTLPRPLSTSSAHRPTRAPIPRRRQTDQQQATRPPPPFVRPAGFKVASYSHAQTVGRSFSTSHVVRSPPPNTLGQGATPWVRGRDGYVSRPGPKKGKGKELPALPLEHQQPTFRRWVSESAPVAATGTSSGPGSGRQRVISASSVLSDAVRKVEIGRLTPWEDAALSSDGDGGAGAGEVMEVVDLSETVVWEVGSAHRRYESEVGGSECASVRGMVVYGSEAEVGEGQGEEDAFVYSHHLAPSTTSSTSTSFDLSPWTFPSPPSNTHQFHSLPSRTWVRPTSFSSSSPGHSPTSSLSRYSLPPTSTHPDETNIRSSVHSSYAGSGYAVSASFSSQMRERSRSRSRSRSVEDDEEEEELKTPQMGVVHLVPEAGELKGEGSVGRMMMEGWSA